MGEKKVIKAALLGFGTVGGGVYKLAGRLAGELSDKTGASLEIRKILVRDMTKPREGVAAELLTDNWQEILEDREIDIVIELMGGIEPARTYVSQALEAGKNVVTANKDLLAEYGGELLEKAEEKGKDLLFEAAVEIAAIKRRRRKIPLFPLDHNCTDALYQQSMEKSSTSLLFI